MIKLIAEYQPSQGFFRFYKEKGSEATHYFFKIIRIDCVESASGDEYFLPVRILNAIKYLGIKCQIEVSDEHESKLMEILFDVGLINDKKSKYRKVMVNF